MMTASELTTCRNLLDMLQDCNGEVADYWGRMLKHIDGQANQIATLKAALAKYVIDDLSDERLSNRMADGGYDSRTDAGLEREAKDQLAKEYPEIFAEE